MARATERTFVEESLMKKVDKYKTDPKYLLKLGQENQPLFQIL